MGFSLAYLVVTPKEFEAMRRKTRKGGDAALFNAHPQRASCAYDDTDALAFFAFLVTAFDSVDEADRAFVRRPIECGESVVAWRFPGAFVELLASITPDAADTLATRCQRAGFGGADAERSNLTRLSRLAVDEGRVLYAFCDTA